MMNERIRELCIESGAWEHYEVNPGVNGDDTPMQRFAELIIAECCVALHPMLRDMISRTQGVDMIVKHFGVE